MSWLAEPETASVKQCSGTSWSALATSPNWHIEVDQHRRVGCRRRESDSEIRWQRSSFPYLLRRRNHDDLSLNRVRSEGALAR